MKVTYLWREWNRKPDYLVVDFLEANEDYFMEDHATNYVGVDDDMPESFQQYAYENGWYDEEIHEVMIEIYIMYLNTQWLM